MPHFKDETAFMQDGNCIGTDPEEFFPNKGGRTVLASRVCGRCPVLDDCLEYALKHMGYQQIGRYGVWGGTQPQERLRILEARGVQVAADEDEDHDVFPLAAVA